MVPLALPLVPMVLPMAPLVEAVFEAVTGGGDLSLSLLVRDTGPCRCLLCC